MEWLATVTYWQGEYGRVLIQDDEKRLYLSHKIYVITPDTVAEQIAMIANQPVTNVKYVDQKNYQRGYRSGQCIFRYVVFDLPDDPPF